jgi:hypothetical protein
MKKIGTKNKTHHRLNQANNSALAAPFSFGSFLLLAAQ